MHDFNFSLENRQYNKWGFISLFYFIYLKLVLHRHSNRDQRRWFEDQNGEWDGWVMMNEEG